MNELTTSYVIGPPRSGTTLIGYLLAGIPDLLSLSEPHLAWDAMPIWKLHRFHDRLRREIGLAKVRPPYQGDHDDYGAYLTRLTQRSGFRHLVLKETWRGGEVMHPDWRSEKLLRTLQQRAPERTTLLIRHPYDTAASTIKLLRFSVGWIGRLARCRWAALPWFPDRSAIVLWAAENWVRFMEWSDELGQAPLRYEDFVSSPATAAPQLCKQLGLPYEEEMLDLRRTRGRFGGLGDPGLMADRPREIRADALGRGRQLTPEERAIVQQRCAKHAEALGYEM